MSADIAAGTEVRRYYEPDVELASRETIDRWQREFLAEAIEYTLERSAFHRDRWAEAGVDPGSIRSREDFVAQAPMFMQKDITAWGAARRDPFGGLLCLSMREVSFIAATSGTTGVPLALPQYSGNPRSVATCRDLWEEQLEPGDTVLSLAPCYRNGYVHAGRDVFERLGLRTVRLESGPMSAAATIEAARQYQPVSLNIMNRPLLYQMETIAAERGLDLGRELASFRGVTFGGEPLDGGLRDKLHNFFGAVRNHTGLGNTIAAVECREADGSHTWEDLVLIEVLDPVTKQPVPEGEVGELVVTTLQERAMPLLRFRTEDLVRYTSRRCRCGRTHGRVWTLGRVGDAIVVHGRAITPAGLFPVMAEIPETRDGVFQIVLGPGEDVSLRVGRRQSPRTDAMVEDDVAAALYRFIGGPVPIELLAAEEILATGSGIKTPRIIRRGG